MKRVIVRYKVTPDKVKENQTLIKAVFSDLNEKRPAGLRYAAFLMEDGQSFIHIASVETKDGSNPVSQLETFKAFQKDIKLRCVEAPVVTEITEVGTYRLFNE